ncbi:hypothetical protein AF335_03910 [Streptomyces eurocidicus]|uniref:DUF6879 domain-containing protein n=1 Tax=Streptomyces eurocidicus TaxID=66423 RepID=A0A2N8P3A5_STREU|nr:DUF6879 family protein [Streptomyces eurocidicus]MBB5117671.1 hypothetical protein [Streptomyces eurocidicus]MBF6053508.1 hypothetical protein [Streptomyces eurocidicus]PNE35481.1 hypothetical protein AF335_03910 [Streptomyces eurocidicus]
MRLDGEAWRAFFDRYEREAFRLETLSLYSMPGEQEEYERYRASGELIIPDDDPWLTRVRGFRNSGRWIGRVHVITRPLSDYLQYEFAVYAHTAKAGEDIRILDLTDHPNPGLPEQDFWMFDNSTVVLMNYGPDGTQKGRDLLSSPDLDQYRHWKDLALSSSVPYAEYIQG